jgi:Holliday junction resolvase RusA-like endonuclease
VAVTLEVFNVQQDVDNVPKCILDGMQGVIYDHDSRIKRLLVVRERDKKGPRVVVHVRALGYAECRLRGWIIPKAFRVEP